jgi:hypothetical protein
MNVPSPQRGERAALNRINTNRVRGLASLGDSLIPTLSQRKSGLPDLRILDRDTGRPGARGERECARRGARQEKTL